MYSKEIIATDFTDYNDSLWLNFPPRIHELF
jgi:hypothetical protein